MEGVSLDFVPGMGLLTAGILLLAVVVAVVLYGWYTEARSQVTAKSEPLKKAA